MPNNKKFKVFDDEAACSGEDSEDPSGDDEDQLSDDFVVADGELSDSHYYDDDEEIKPVRKSSTITKSVTGGKRKSPAVAKGNKSATKPPGDSSYPVHEFSLTITKTKDDIGLDALESVAQFIEQNCLKGGVATEVGRRAFQLHLQGLMKLRWPSTKEHVQRLQKLLKSILPANGKLYKVLVKPFASSQTFSAMVGYIRKDQGILYGITHFNAYLFILILLALQDSPIINSEHTIFLDKSCHLAEEITMHCSHHSTTPKKISP